MNNPIFKLSLDSIIECWLDYWTKAIPYMEGSAAGKHGGFEQRAGKLF